MRTPAEEVTARALAQPDGKVNGYSYSYSYDDDYYYGATVGAACAARAADVEPAFDRAHYERIRASVPREDRPPLPPGHSDAPSDAAPPLVEARPHREPPADADEVAVEPPSYHRCPDLVAMIMERADEGFVPHTLGGEELYRLRLGGVAILTGAPGTGKTSMAVGIAIDHARARGPVVYCSLEMDADELGARGIGMQCDASWEDVLCGRVRREFMDDALGLPRLVVLDSDAATLSELERAVLALRSECRDQPILVIVDYLQILPGDEREVRARVAAAAQAVRRLAKRLRVVVLAISQPSRAAGRALSAGELLGGESMTAMAESAEIERAAYITLALGASGAEHEDGSRVLDLSIGKGRFGGGDRVRPLRYWGASGRMRLDGDARSAADVRAEREGQKDSAKQHAAELAIMRAAEQAKEPQTREALVSVAACPRAVSRAAIAALLERGDLVEVAQRRPKSKAHLIWTPERASGAGVALASEVP